MTAPRTITALDDAVAALRRALELAVSPLMDDAAGYAPIMHVRAIRDHDLHVAVQGFISAWDELWAREQAFALFETADRLIHMARMAREAANTIGGLDEARGYLAAIRAVAGATGGAG